MPSMGAIIQSHNAKILAPPSVQGRLCNCKRSAQGTPVICPLDGRCLSSSIVYKATVSTPSNNPPKIYFGLSEGTFKSRYQQHMTSFRYAGKRQATRLSEYIWGLKDNGIQYSIKWEIARRSRPYKCRSRHCDLCASEKVSIALADDRILLNKRSEIISRCRHRAKFKCSPKASSNL